MIFNWNRIRAQFSQHQKTHPKQKVNNDHLSKQQNNKISKPKQNKQTNEIEKEKDIGSAIVCAHGDQIVIFVFVFDKIQCSWSKKVSSFSETIDVILDFLHNNFFRSFIKKTKTKSILQ